MLVGDQGGPARDAGPPWCRPGAVPRQSATPIASPFLPDTRANGRLWVSGETGAGAACRGSPAPCAASSEPRTPDADSPRIPHLGTPGRYVGNGSAPTPQWQGQAAKIGELGRTRAPRCRVSGATVQDGWIPACSAGVGKPPPRPASSPVRRTGRSAVAATRAPWTPTAISGRTPTTAPARRSTRCSARSQKWCGRAAVGRGCPRALRARWLIMKFPLAWGKFPRPHGRRQAACNEASIRRRWARVAVGYLRGGRGAAEAAGRTRRAGSIVRSVSGLKPWSTAQSRAWVRRSTPIFR